MTKIETIDGRSLSDYYRREAQRLFDVIEASTDSAAKLVIIDALRGAFKGNLQELADVQAHDKIQALTAALQAAEQRAEEKAAYEREYIAQTDAMLACGPVDDPASEACGECRACALNRAGKAEAALAAERAKVERLLKLLRDSNPSGREP